MKLLLTMIILLTLATNSFALTLKIKILTNKEEEVTVSVNNFKKITQNHIAVFEVDKGFVDVEVEEKKITKYINKDSFLVIKSKG